MIFRRFAQQQGGAEGLVQSFDSRCHVHCVSNHGELHSFGRTNAADNRAPGINADPDSKRRLIGAHQIGIEKFETAQHRTSGRYGIVGMRRRAGAGAEDRHETVAQKFVNHAAVFRLHDFDHGLEKSIEKIDDRFRIGLGRARGESAKIEKEESNDLIGATETRVTGQDLLRNLFADVQNQKRGAIAPCPAAPLPFD